MASPKKTKQASQISKGIIGLGLIGGGYRGFCQAQTISMDSNLEGLIVSIPLLGAGALGFIMQAGVKEEYLESAERGLEPKIEEARLRAIEKGKNPKNAMDYEANMLSTRGFIMGAFFGGVLGAISSAAGYGVGYSLGYLMR